MLLDDRIGSKHLLKPLGDMGVHVELTRMESGDAVFMGTDQEGAQVSVGVEVKTVHEIISDLTLHRFSGFQLPNMMREHPWRYLIVEGVCRPDPFGKSPRLLLPRGKVWKPAMLGKRVVTYGAFTKYLLTISIQTQTPVIRTYGKPETASMLACLYRWWTRGWLSHKSLEALYVPPQPKLPSQESPGLVRKAACLLEGVSWGKSKAVEEAFPTVEAMCQADEETWAAIPGIGPILARRAVMQLRGEVQ